jgi:hypothetical protein
MLAAPGAALEETIRNKIENAGEDELRSLWENFHGVCTSWVILVASKIATDFKGILFLDEGHHRMAITTCGILIDSSARVALQLQDGVSERYGDIEYTMKGQGRVR